jgi:hypothetical protein
MMSLKNWLQNLLSVIEEIADEDYQKLVWMGKDPTRVSSFEEVVCRFFDDYDIDGFLEKYCHEDSLPRDQCLHLTELRNMLEKAADVVDTFNPPEKTLNHEVWIAIRSKAKQTLEAFGK